MIVIDIGCARYGGDYSVERLIEEFHPEILYGFDPNEEGLAAAVTTDSKTTIVLQHAAAWTYDGEIGYVPDGLTTWLSEMKGTPTVPCFDLARFIRDLPSDQEIVLKIDAEKSEYGLLEHLIKTRTDELLESVWVEWHCETCGRGGGGHRPGCKEPVDHSPRRQWIEENISCELMEWNW